MYKVIRDTQEKKNKWHFEKLDACAGTQDCGLETGDYTLEGIENIFTIERKATTGELAGNLTSKRFAAELKRMQKMKYTFIVCEFSLEDITKFPYNSGIPPCIWHKLKVTAPFILKRIVEIETTNKVKIIFAGNSKTAQLIAKVIFKRMAALYAEETKVV